MEKETILSQSHQPELNPNATFKNKVKFFLFSSIGLFMFFVPVTIDGKSSIMLDHFVTAIQAFIPAAVPYYALLVILLGAIYPFYTKTWNKNKVNIVFSIFKVIGLFTAVMIVFGFGPAWLFDPSMGPFCLTNSLSLLGCLFQSDLYFLLCWLDMDCLNFSVSSCSQL